MMRLPFNFTNHPGTPHLFFIVIMGALAGAERVGLWPLWGACIMLGLFGPIYLIGAYNRKDTPDE